MKKSSKKYFGFTLVELIIVITILAILATVAFVSFQNYTKSSRDSNRLASISTLEKGLEVYNVKVGTYPLPDNKATITLSGVEVSYQGIFGDMVSKQINANKTPLDPLDNTSYFYATNTSQKGYKLLGYSENQTSYTNNQAYAIDYTTRNQITKGGLPIITDSNKNVIQTNIDLFTNGSGTLYNEILDDKTIITGSGIEIGGGYQMLSLKNGDYGAPKSCPDGYIPAVGSTDFSQPGFCVAKYEMSYDGFTSPNTNFNLITRNTIKYNGINLVVSKPGNYPIAEITQTQAIQECTKIGGHLITNNEWMTLARQIENNPVNWSNGIIGSGFLNTGVSDSTVGSCGVTKDIYGLIRDYGAKTGEGLSNSTGAIDCDKKRKHTLANGQIIFDLAGNLWEHVNKANTIDGRYYNNSQTSISGVSNGISWDSDGIYTNSDMKKYSSPNFYGQSYGIGSVYYGNGINQDVFIRGGMDGDSNTTGIYSIGLSLYSSSYETYVGFRCTY